MDPLLIKRIRLTALLLACSLAADARPNDEITDAEKQLFLNDQLSALAPPATLSYAFSHSGRQDKPFHDTVDVRIVEEAGLRKVTTACLSGENRKDIPDIDGALSNPALMCFLERDIAEMERLTGGKAAYFRKRIRLALSEGPAAEPLKVRFEDRTVEARAFRITPYRNDPNAHRFPKYVGKVYVFVLSDAVPGGIYQVTSRIPDSADPDGAAMLIEDSMVLRGRSEANR
jgi:hypothetical protein